MTVDVDAEVSWGRHALVIYDPRGKVMLDLLFEDVMLGRSREARCFIGTSGPFVSQCFTVKFVVRDTAHVALRDARGTTFVLTTGNRALTQGVGVCCVHPAPPSKRRPSSICTRGPRAGTDRDFRQLFELTRIRH